VLYMAKLSILTLPEAYLVMPVALLLLTAASPMYLHEVPPGRRRFRLVPWQGLAHVAANVAAVLLARFALFDVAQWVMAGRPHESLMTGVLLVAMAAANVPLVFRCYRGSQVGAAGVGGCWMGS